jgi:hypothetical protein
MRLLLALVLLIGARRATAQSGSWCQRLPARPPDTAEVAFVGRVLEVAPLPGSASKLDQTFSEYWVTSILVERVWKVRLPDTVQVLTQYIGSSFDSTRPQARSGDPFLILAKSAVQEKHLADLRLAERDTVYASYCTGWLPVSALDSLGPGLGRMLQPAP